MHVYETVIKLSLVEHGVLSGMSAVVAMLARGTGETKKFESALGNLKLAAWGAAGVFAGWETIKGIKILADHAKELSHELVQIKKLNESMSSKDFEQIKTWAFGMPSRVPGTTSVEALKTYGSIQSMFGKDQATAMGDTIARFGQVLGNQKGDWSNTSEQVLKMIRSGDLLGKFVDATTHKVDVGRLQKFLDLGTKVINATHGMVNPATWFQMAQQGGPALSNMTDEGLMSMAMAAQGMGGFRSGTAMTSLYQQMIGGKMTQYVAQELQGLGLVGGYSVGKGGHVLWDKGALDTPFTQMIQKDPLKATEIMRQALEKGGYTSIETQVPELFKMLGRQTTQRLLHDFLRNMPQMLGERGRLEGGMGVFGSADLANQQDYMQVMHNATAAWNDMMAKIGLPVTIAAIPIMHKITDVFLKLGTLAIDPANAVAIEHIAQGVTALGAALIGGGGVAMLAALGPAGWIAAGIIATGTAMALNRGAIQGLIDKLNALSDVCRAAVSKIGDAVAWLWEKVGDLAKRLLGISYTGGGFGGGDGITNAAWSGGGGAAGRALSSGERGMYASMIRQYGGDQAGNLLKIYGTEGASGYVGDYGSSFGPFQLHMGGLAGGSNRFSGMGDIFRRETGLDPRDKSTVRAQIEWMKRYGETHGVYSSDIWHGLRTHGGSLSAHPAHLPPPRRDQTVVINHITNLDGKQIARNTVKHIVRSAQYPTSVGRQDGRAVFMGPGAEIFA